MPPKITTIFIKDKNVAHFSIFIRITKKSTLHIIDLL